MTVNKETKTKIRESVELPVGVHTVGKDEVIVGYKQFFDCRLPLSWSDWFKGHRETSYTVCWAPISVGEGGTVVRPLDRDQAPGEVTLRADELNIGDITTQCGKKCTSAKTVAMDQHFTKTYCPNRRYTSKLNTDTKKLHVPGLDFYPEKSQCIIMMS